MSTNIGEFMNALGECCDRENYLSDIVYAMCKSNQAFRKFFVDFFFREWEIDVRQVDISREYRFESYRPDFLIETKEDIFIIEVKVNDQKQHFKDYERALKDLYRESSKKKPDMPRDHVGYIANYKINSHKTKEATGFRRIHTWLEFYNLLELYDWLGDEAVKGFGRICKSVCGFVDFKKEGIRINDFKTIKTSMEWIEKVIGDSEDDYNVIPFDGYYQQACTQGFRIGRFFEVRKFRGSLSVWGWVGVYLVETGAEFVVAFDDKKGWGNLVCDDVGRSYPQNETIEYADSDAALYFYMNGSFNEKNVRDFFRSTIQYIRGDKEAFKCEARKLADCNAWLIMSRLPEMIRSELFGEWEADGITIAIDSNRMSVYDYAKSVRGACLECFRLSFKVNGSGLKREMWGFVGVAWGECQWISKDMFDGGDPLFLVGVWNLGKKEVKLALKNRWREQKGKNDNPYIHVIEGIELCPVSIKALRKKFREVVKTIIEK